MKSFFFTSERPTQEEEEAATAGGGEEERGTVYHESDLNRGSDRELAQSKRSETATEEQLRRRGGDNLHPSLIPLGRPVASFRPCSMFTSKLKLIHSHGNATKTLKFEKYKGAVAIGEAMSSETELQKNLKRITWQYENCLSCVWFAPYDPVNADLLARGDCKHSKLKGFNLVVSGRDWCNLFKEITQTHIDKLQELAMKESDSEK